MVVNLYGIKVNEMKAEILTALREAKGYISGEKVSKSLGTSRVSIWKHIRDLKRDGYVIEASPRGYRLVSSPDLLLPCEFPELEPKVHHFHEIGSTMNIARELARKGVKEGTLVIAERQTTGRGRLSREWQSPQGGIYFTIVLKPRISPVYAPRINLMASVAVAKTIRKLFGLNAELKWPNDVLINGKKVCGILAEMDAETDTVNFVNVGIGINANSPISQLEHTATSLKEELGREISRKEFLRSLVKEINEQYALLTRTELLEEWKNLSVTLNKWVRVISLGETMEGQAIDIDASGALLIRDKDGLVRAALAGDCIHLR